MKTSFPNPDDILNFTLIIEPDEGMYKGGSFNFNFTVNQNFPHDPPKVKCTQKIYHPNIDLEGNVCLNILREDWKPVLNLNAVIVGLQVCYMGEIFGERILRDEGRVSISDLEVANIMDFSFYFSNQMPQIPSIRKQRRIYDRTGRVSREMYGRL